MPTELAVGVLADDLTGALASAARLHEGGWRPLVAWHEVLPEAAGSAVVVDMRTRDYGRDPGARALSWARLLSALGCSWIELRIDSTLRGDPAAEISGVLAGAGPATVLAVPAFPDAGRTVVGGCLRAPVALPGGDADVARVLFGADAGKEAGLLPVELIEAGPDAIVSAIDGSDRANFVADGTGEEHLRVMADAARSLIDGGRRLLTVSPGAWLRYFRPGPEPAFVLVVLSSNTPTNHEQLERLCRHSAVTVTSARDVVAGRADPLGSPCGPGSRHTIVIETITEEVGDDTAAWLQSTLAARATEQVLNDALRRRATCAGMVVGGGQTASAVMDVLGAAHLVVGDEVAPLCPRARVTGGGWDGLPVITKGGLVGGTGTLACLVDTLWRDHLGCRAPEEGAPGRVAPGEERSPRKETT